VVSVSAMQGLLFSKTHWPHLGVWSPDGKEIAIEDDRGGAKRALWSGMDGGLRNASWSPRRTI
jgi:hypothetical protein